MKKTKLVLNKTTIKNLTLSPRQLGSAHGGGVSEVIWCPPSGGCNSVAATACTNTKDVCPSDACGPSVHNSPEC